MRLGGQVAAVCAIITLALAATWRSGDAAGAQAGRAISPDRHHAAAAAPAPGGAGAPTGAAAGGGAAGGAAGATVMLTGVGLGGAALAAGLNAALSSRLGDGAGWATVAGEAESLPAPPPLTLLRVRWSVAGRGGLADCGTVTVSATARDAITGELGDAFAAVTRRAAATGQATCA